MKQIPEDQYTLAVGFIADNAEDLAQKIEEWRDDQEDTMDCVFEIKSLQAFPFGDSIQALVVMKLNYTFESKE